MGELVRDMDHTWCTCVCVHNTKRPNSTHPITVISPMQAIMSVMNRCLHTRSESSWHAQQRHIHSLLHLTHNHSLVWYIISILMVY